MDDAADEEARLAFAPLGVSLITDEPTLRPLTPAPISDREIDEKTDEVCSLRAPPCAHDARPRVLTTRAPVCSRAHALAHTAAAHTAAAHALANALANALARVH